MVNNVVLTHMLIPEYFGLVALSSTLILGMTMLSDVGLLPSVVSSPRGDEPLFLNTAWTIQIVRGVSLWLIAVAMAFPLAILYKDHRIVTLLPVLAFSMVLQGLFSTNLLRAGRHMHVRRLLIIELATQVFGIIVMFVWAVEWPSVWALVAGALASSGSKMVVSHIQPILPGVRNRLVWDKTCATSLIHIGKWILMGTALYFFASQADKLILGKLVTFTILGIYNIAFTIADIPRQVIGQFCMRVALPFMSKLTHLPFPEFRDNVRKYRLYVLFAGAVVLSIVVNAGGPLVLAIYDSRYHAASWMVPILALGLWHTLMYSTTIDILLSMGKPFYNAWGTAAFCFTMFVGLPIAFHYGGLLGAIICVAAGDVPYYLVLEFGAQREKISLWRQDALATSVFAALCATGFAIRHFVFHSNVFDFR
jgi:O-antigen/teichoic acid export membrane protein